MWHSITARMPLRNQERPRLRESAELLRGLRMFASRRRFLRPMSTKSPAIARKGEV
jgi:hypothetical protein